MVNVEQEKTRPGSVVDRSFHPCLLLHISGVSNPCVSQWTSRGLKSGPLLTSQSYSFVLLTSSSKERVLVQDEEPLSMPPKTLPQ